MNIVQKDIERKLNKVKKGQLLFLADFRGFGSEAAIKMALSRLVKQEKVNRIAHGIYLVPKSDPVLGLIFPSMEQIAEAIAKRDHVKIKPAGAYALHKLGLTTQVPTRLVYLTNGAPREIKIGKTSIKFKATTSKKFALRGKLSSLIIQALEEINPANIDPEMKQRIKELLAKEDPKKLGYDIKLAPARISDFLYELLKESK